MWAAWVTAAENVTTNHGPARCGDAASASKGYILAGPQGTKPSPPARRGVDLKSLVGPPARLSERTTSAGKTAARIPPQCAMRQR